MRLTIIIDDEIAQENVRKLWTNRIDVTKIINEMLAGLKFEFKYDFEPITIQEPVTNHNKLEQPRKSRQLVTDSIRFEPSSFS